VSWWPDGGGGSKRKRKVISNVSVPASLHSYAEDCDSEGKKPDYTYNLGASFSEAEIEKFWNVYKKNLVYRLFDANCACTVYRALRAGGLDECINVSGVLAIGGPWEQLSLTITPGQVRDLCERVKRAGHSGLCNY
ncbi:MAG TPA: hypothetical protein VEQ63_10535, partial [Bryobacteraceae bacterium]|nr:hypothetical protein [Bryobacteraceae bacterium]